MASKTIKINGMDRETSKIVHNGKKYRYDYGFRGDSTMQDIKQEYHNISQQYGHSDENVLFAEVDFSHYLVYGRINPQYCGTPKVTVVKTPVVWYADYSRKMHEFKFNGDKYKLAYRPGMSAVGLNQNKRSYATTIKEARESIKFYLDKMKSLAKRGYEWQKYDFNEYLIVRVKDRGYHAYVEDK